MTSDSFKQTLVSAMGWSLAMKVGFQALSWAMTLVVIRVLSPDDYGLMALSQVFTAFMLGFANLGLGDALVQKQDASRLLVANAFGMLLVVSMALTVALAAAAYPIAAWYGDERLVLLLQVSSLGFLFNALTTLPRAKLSKNMHVRSIFVAELSSGLLGSVTVVVLAFTGHGVWSLMLGWLVSNIARQIAFFIVAHNAYTWPRFDFRAVKPLIGFGAYSTLEYTAWMLMVSADVLIVGRLLGPTALGLYTVVLNFAAMPLTKIAPIVNSVAFPAFAMVQHRPIEARLYVLKAVRLMSLLTVPVFLGMGATSPEIVNLVFGPAWIAAQPLLPILSVALTFRALLILMPNYLLGIGDAKAAFWCTATGAVLFPIAILVGCRWGIAGACYGWLVCYPIVFGFEALIAARRGSLSFRNLIASPIRPLAAGAVMAAVVVALREYLPPSLDDLPRLACLAATGAAVYVATIMVGFPQLASELRDVVRPRKAV